MLTSKSQTLVKISRSRDCYGSESGQTGTVHTLSLSAPGDVDCLPMTWPKWPPQDEVSARGSKSSMQLTSCTIIINNAR